MSTWEGSRVDADLPIGPPAHAGDATGYATGSSEVEDVADFSSDFGAVPDAGPDAVVDPHWLELRGRGDLPAVYMPPAMGAAGPRPPWLRAMAFVLIALFLTATAAGVCLTYGPPQAWP